MNQLPLKLSSEKLVNFPNLTRRNHGVTSDPTPDSGPEPLYNCVAWAAGVNDVWWWPDDPLCYWPPGIPSELTLAAFVAAFETLGYETCDDGLLEVDVEKVVIYVDGNGFPTHVARQLITGRWTSKLGRWEDIEHTTELVLQGNGQFHYGSARQYMKRPRSYQTSVP